MPNPLADYDDVLIPLTVGTTAAAMRAGRRVDEALISALTRRYGSAAVARAVAYGGEAISWLVWGIGLAHGTPSWYIPGPIAAILPASVIEAARAVGVFRPGGAARSVSAIAEAARPATEFAFRFDALTTALPARANTVAGNIVAIRQLRGQEYLAALERLQTMRVGSTFARQVTGGIPIETAWRDAQIRAVAELEAAGIRVSDLGPPITRISQLGSGARPAVPSDFGEGLAMSRLNATSRIRQASAFAAGSNPLSGVDLGEGLGFPALPSFETAAFRAYEAEARANRPGFVRRVLGRAFESMPLTPNPPFPAGPLARSFAVESALSAGRAARVIGVNTLRALPYAAQGLAVGEVLSELATVPPPPRGEGPFVTPYQGATISEILGITALSQLSDRFGRYTENVVRGFGRPAPTSPNYAYTARQLGIIAEQNAIRIGNERRALEASLKALGVIEGRATRVNPLAEEALGDLLQGLDWAGAGAINAVRDFLDR